MGWVGSVCMTAYLGSAQEWRVKLVTYKRMLLPTGYLRVFILPCNTDLCERTLPYFCRSDCISKSKTRKLGTEAVGQPMGLELALGVSRFHAGLQRRCIIVKCRVWSSTWPAVRR